MKNKNLNYVYIALGVLLGGVIFYYIITFKKQQDWNESFDRTSQQPYGMSILYEMLPTFVFKNTPVKPIEYSIYDHLKFDYCGDTLQSESCNVDSLISQVESIEDAFLEDDTMSNYLFINDFFAVHSDDVHGLTTTLELGSEVFIATRNLSINNPILQYIEIAPNKPTKKHTINWLLSNKEFVFDEDVCAHYIKLRHEIPGLTVIAENEFKLPVLVKIPYGNGFLYVSSTPLAFSNFYMVHPRNFEYISKALSLINDTGKVVYWGGNYSSYMPEPIYKNPEKDTPSLLKFIFSKPPLKWAFILLMITLIAFILFEAKRKQRATPVVKKLKNSTVEFTTFIASMYQQKGDDT